MVCVALVLGAGIAAANVFWRAWPPARSGLVPTIVCFVVLQVSGWYVSSFIVKPNELVREQPYIAHNIKMTRQAYDLDRVSQHEFAAETEPGSRRSGEQPGHSPEYPLWDWRALQDTLRQIQEIRTYYDFPDIDIDRYDIDGTCGK